MRICQDLEVAGNTMGRVRLSVMALAVTLAGLVACTGGADDASVEAGDPSLAGVATATFDSDTARMRLIVGLDDGSDDIYEGVVRFGSDPALELSIVGQPEEDFSAPNIRAFADAMYLGDGGDWLEIDNDEAARDIGIQLERGTSPLIGLIEIMLGSLDHADPDTVREIGTEQLHDTTVTKYVADVDVGAALRSRGVVLDEDTFAEAVALFGPVAVVWVDDQDRVHRVQLDADPDAQADDRVATESTTIELWDFGIAVDVERPEVTLFTDEELDATARLRTDIPETDDAYCQVRRRLMVTLGDPTDVVTDWIDAGGSVQAGIAIIRGEANTAAPDELVDNDQPLIELYTQVADLLDAGLTLDEIRERGLVVEGGPIEWDRAVAKEQLILAGQANFCALVARGESQGG